MTRTAGTWLLALLLSGCATPAWKHDAMALGLPESEAAAMVRAAETRHRQPAMSLKQESDGRVAVWLSEEGGHGGTIVWFAREGGAWVEKESGPWWE